MTQGEANPRKPGRRMSADGLLARELGVNTRAVKDAGGAARYEAMSEDARALIFGRIKKCDPAKVAAQ